MARQGHEMDSLQMQVVRLVAGLQDESLLLSLRDGLNQRLNMNSNGLSDEELGGIDAALSEIENGHIFSKEEVQRMIRAKLKGR